MSDGEMPKDNTPDRSPQGGPALTPPTSSGSGDDPQAGPAVETPKPRSRRIYVYWAVALALLLAAGLFSWKVVVPVWQVQHVIDEIGCGKLRPAAAVERLGGPESAAPSLIMYRRLPEVFRRRLQGLHRSLSGPPDGRLWSCPDAWIAYLLLVECKGPAVDYFVDELADDSPGTRYTAAEALGLMEAPRAVGPLEAALSDENPEVRRAAAEALERIRGAKRLEKREPQK